VGFRGAILILGTRRLKKKGKGLSEGYQWVPYPLATLITVDCREKTLDIGDEDGAPSKDRVFFTVKAIRQFKVNDVYRYQGTEGPVEALRRVDLQALRTEMKQFMAVDLQVTDKTSLSNKVSKRSEDELEKKDNANGKRWGLDVGDVIISDIKVNSKEVAEAWASIPKEQSEREAEKIQAEALVQQVTTLKGLDIDPAFALASAQAHAGKNVEVKTVNIPGLQEGLANMAKTIGDSLGAILKRAVTKE
jgi:regulator of protease activity HflC (stomatin/prohibitin superfamily)